MENTFSEELQKEIEQKGLKLYPLSGRYYEGSPIDYNSEVRNAYIAGATEYAQYKGKYEQAMVLLEDAYKFGLRYSKALTDAEVEQEWSALKEKHNL